MQPLLTKVSHAFLSYSTSHLPDQNTEQLTNQARIHTYTLETRASSSLSMLVSQLISISVSITLIIYCSNFILCFKEDDSNFFTATAWLAAKCSFHGRRS